MFREDAGTGGLEGLADCPREPLRMYNEHRKAAQEQKPPVALSLSPPNTRPAAAQLQAGPSPTADFYHKLAFPGPRGLKLALSG